MPEESLEEQVDYIIEKIHESFEILEKLRIYLENEYIVAIEAGDRVLPREFILGYLKKLKYKNAERYEKYARWLKDNYNHLCPFTRDIKIFNKQITRKIEPITEEDF